MKKKEKKKEQWILSGWCPECRKFFEILSSVNLSQVTKHKKYYQLMLNNDRPVAKCGNCGAYYEKFELNLSYREILPFSEAIRSL